ncbi:MAG: prepilin-type N-terminal cleavage/methylation domain-containing protein [Myxococcota bacterium]
MASRRARRGMTLIEVGVVVTILLVVMLGLSVGVAQVSSTFGSSQIDEARLRAAREQEVRDIEALRAGLGAASPAVVLSEDVDVTVRAAPLAEGLRVVADLDVDVHASFLVRNDAELDAVSVTLPVSPLVDAVRLTLQDLDGRPVAPVSRQVDDGVLRFSAPLAPGGTLTAELSYTFRGRDALSLPVSAALPQGAHHPLDLQVDLTLPPGFAPQRPPASLAPLRATDTAWRWEVAGAVAPPPVQLELSAGHTLTGRVVSVLRLAALGLLAFCAGLWYLREAERPGDLDDFRLGGLLLLALNYCSFYAIFGVAAPRVGLVAAPLAAVVTLPLLTLHVARLTRPRFAWTRALPLAAATMGSCWPTPGPSRRARRCCSGWASPRPRS